MKKIYIIILATIIFIITISMYIFIHKNNKNFILSNNVYSYSFVLEISTKTKKAAYEGNVDLNRHDLHFGDINYTEAKTKYYRYLKEKKQIIYYTYNCSSEYIKENVCVLQWNDYVTDYYTEEEVEQKDATNLYLKAVEISNKYNLNSKEKMVSLNDLLDIFNYINFIDSDFIENGDDYLISVNKDNNYLYNILIKGKKDLNFFVNIKFKNFNKFKNVEDLLEIDSRVNEP